MYKRQVLNNGGPVDLGFIKFNSGLNEVSSELFEKALKLKVSGVSYFQALVDSGRLEVKPSPVSKKPEAEKTDVKKKPKAAKSEVKKSTKSKTKALKTEVKKDTSK